MKKATLFIVLYMCCEYFGNAMYANFLPLYYQSAKGLTPAQISLLAALAPLVSMLAQPMWGSMADRAKKKNHIHGILLLGSCLGLLLYAVGQGFLFMAFATMLYTLFSGSINTMGETVLMEYSVQSGKPFGLFRMCGTLAFGVGALLAGTLVDESRIWLFAPFCALFYLLGAIMTQHMPPIAGAQRETEPVSLRSVLHDKVFLSLLLLVALLQMSQGLYFTFFPLRMAGFGLSTAWIGLATLVTTFAEAPFLLFSDKLLARLGTLKLILIAALTMMLRWFILALTDNPTVILLSQLLNGTGFIVMAFSMLQYVGRNFPKALQARGQMFVAMLGYGASRVIGGLLGGLVSQLSGGSTTAVFLLCSALGAVAFFGMGIPLYIKTDRGRSIP